MKDFRFKISFSSLLRPLVSEEKDKYLAMASFLDVANFIPDVDVSKNYDLLPIAFNAFVVNRINKNGDVIDTETALSIANYFVNKPINIEHNRKNVIGVILNVGFSEFGSDLPLKAEDIKDSKKPFNITLGGVLWRIVNPDVVTKIEDSTDPANESFQSISASWELGFDDFKIVSTSAGSSSKNLEDCVPLLGDCDEISKHLKSFGGSGEINGQKVYRQPVGEVLPLGIGLTESPAAEVKGISSQNTQLPQKNISQSQDFNVNQNRRDMKITKVQDITDETLKQINASAITEFLAEQIKEASKQYESEKEAHKLSLEAAQKAKENVTKVEGELNTLKQKVEAFEKQEAERAKVVQFNSRMESVEAEYELSDEIRQVLASQIKVLDKDEDFASWKKNMEVFLKPLSKAAKKKTDEDAKKAADDEEAKKNAKKDSKASDALDNAMDNAEKKKAALANSSVADKNKAEKWKDALKDDGFEIK
jgi:hypothetical protein